ncbi:DNA adenine methylase [Salinisphaera sp. S4-8]|uniref:Dam family site-specific DNA-(adenine-N6)-methyltransferase n=1 Tax=Salinisphaera sp. S4-8 TaxID=633357 RepID=UPI0033413EAA
MTNPVIVPPIKSQGIKTKLVPWIRSLVPDDFSGRWIEPFMGTGVVGLNVAPRNVLLCDTNPHLVAFYKSIQSGAITPAIVRDYLEREGEQLRSSGDSHYYFIRKRFNEKKDPLDFLFLNRAGFNGMIRFNRKGEFNIPFCKKPKRFARAYVTKIVNQVAAAQEIITRNSFEFKCQEFSNTVAEASDDDIIYCDPPYIDRHVDYFNAWDSDNEEALFKSLDQSSASFILSTWHHNKFRSNKYIDTHWGVFKILTQEHFYHVGGRENNRNSMVEALVTSLDVGDVVYASEEPAEQLRLLEARGDYQTA